jgi:putative nucleotidyltransferase with HDIG domain
VRGAAAAAIPSGIKVGVSAADHRGVNFRLTPSRAILFVAAIAPALLYLLARRVLAGEFELPTLHLFAVTGTAGFAALVSLMMTRVALRRNDLRAGLVGVAFTATGGLLVIHGLATPGIFLEEYGRNATVGLAGVLAVPVGGVLLALAVVVPPASRHAAGLIWRGQAACVIVLTLFGVIGLLHPALIPLVPLMVHPWVYFVLIPVASAYAWIARRAHHTHQLTGRRADLFVAVGLVWLGCSVPLYLLSPAWTIGFWFAHLLEGLGFVSVAGAVAVDLARQVPSHHLFRRLTGGELVESEESLLGGYVRALTATMELRDPSTREHSRRVARLAVEVGSQMGLGAAATRRLAIAGLLHDIGKLQVPESILNKPDRLTDEEFAVIRTHPGRGAELLLHLGGFEQEVPIVLSHHERFAGGGYPDGRSGESIPLEARILTACDVFDALTSRRAYREPWPEQRALALLRDESGTTFDPACVEALLEVLGAGEGRERVTVLRQTLRRGAATSPSFPPAAST